MVCILYKQRFINIIIILNGLYDILCAISILILPHYKIPLFSIIHTEMITQKITPITKNYLAYWIFTYGFMRLYNLEIAFYSYLIEAIFFFNELINKRIHIKKGLFTITMCIYLAFNISYLHYTNTIQKKYIESNLNTTQKII